MPSAWRRDPPPTASPSIVVRMGHGKTGCQSSWSVACVQGVQTRTRHDADSPSFVQQQPRRRVKRERAREQQRMAARRRTAGGRPVTSTASSQRPACTPTNPPFFLPYARAARGWIGKKQVPHGRPSHPGQRPEPSQQRQAPHLTLSDDELALCRRRRQCRQAILRAWHPGH
jgi:hypothetical protein